MFYNVKYCKKDNSDLVVCGNKFKRRKRSKARRKQIAKIGKNEVLEIDNKPNDINITPNVLENEKQQ